MSRVLVAGLVGGIASGKSEVARLLGLHGAVVMDSDAAAHRVLQRPEVIDELRRWWGSEVIGPDGKANRAKLAAIVFNDPAQRSRLEALVHPLLGQERSKEIKALRAGPADLSVVVVIDAPLLLEAGVDRECDVVIFVDAPRELRLRRAEESRGWDAAELARREASQWPLDRKRARADMLVRNDGDQAALRLRVEQLWDELRRRAEGLS